MPLIGVEGGGWVPACRGQRWPLWGKGEDEGYVEGEMLVSHYSKEGFMELGKWFS